MSSLSDYLSTNNNSLENTHRTNSATSLSSASSTESSPLSVLASSQVLLNGILTPATIVISQTTGKIISIHERILLSTAFPPESTTYKNYTPYVLLPGLVDAHVHLNEPGRTEWEGFYTGTQAAAFGGVTTVVDMPLNAIPPTTTVANLNEKIAAAQGKCWVDVGFYGGMIPGNAHELVPLVKAGVRGFKGFLIDSGVPEFPAISSLDISKALTALRNQKTIIMFHAEMTPPLSLSVGDEVQSSLPPLVPVGPLTEYNTFLASRPPAFETYAIEEIISLSHLIGPEPRLHIVHLSTVEAIPILRAAREAGVNITAETCFHYLTFASESIADGDTRHKCCPPIRSQANQDQLWEEILQEDKESVIQTIVSDHSPCTPTLKLLPASVDAASEQASDSGAGDFFKSWGGISSVGLGLPILFTEYTRRFPSTPLPVVLAHIIRWCSEATAEQVGLQSSKGKLAVGMDGDVVVFDPESNWTVEKGGLLFRNKISPYQGWNLRGVVRETWLRSGKVFDREEGFSKGGVRGRLILEERVR